MEGEEEQSWQKSQRLHPWVLGKRTQRNFIQKCTDFTSCGCSVCGLWKMREIKNRTRSDVCYDDFKYIISLSNTVQWHTIVWKSRDGESFILWIIWFKIKLETSVPSLKISWRWFMYSLWIKQPLVFWRPGVDRGFSLKGLICHDMGTHRQVV